MCSQHLSDDARFCDHCDASTHQEILTMEQELLNLEQAQVQWNLQ